MATDMLARASLDGSALECGAHWPQSQEATVALARSGGTPSALHNNCSGKHAGFLCGCRHLRINHPGYVGADHPYQEMVRRTMAEVTGAEHGERNRGIDGCSIPTYAVPLSNLATGFARMATGNGLPADRATAAKRLFAACMAEPFLRRRNGALRYRTDEGSPWPHLREGRRRRRPLRGGAGTRPRHRAEMRRRPGPCRRKSPSRPCWPSCSRMTVPCRRRSPICVRPVLKNWNGISTSAGCGRRRRCSSAAQLTRLRSMVRLAWPPAPSTARSPVAGSAQR